MTSRKKLDELREAVITAAKTVSETYGSVGFGSTIHSLRAAIENLEKASAE